MSNKESKKQDKMTIGEQFASEEFGKRDGYYGRNFMVVLPPGVDPEMTGKVEFEDADREPILFPDNDSYHNTTGKSCRITINPEDPSQKPQVFYGQTLDHTFLNNSQKNYSEVRYVTEEAWKALKKGDLEHREIPENIREASLEKRKRTEKFERAESKREKLAQRLYEKYEKQYKETNPNLAKAISPERIKKCLDEMAINRVSYSEFDKFMLALENMNERLKQNVPSLISLTMSYSNAGIENAISKYATCPVPVSDGYSPFHSIVEDYVSAEHERLTGRTPEQSIGELNAKNMTVEEMRESNYARLDLPYMHVEFSSWKPQPDVTQWDVSGSSIHLPTSKTASAMARLHPETAPEIREECLRRIQELEEASKTWPKEYSYNENPVSENNYYFERRDEVIASLKEIVDDCEKVIEFELCQSKKDEEWIEVLTNAGMDPEQAAEVVANARNAKELVNQTHEDSKRNQYEYEEYDDSMDIVEE